MFNQEKFPWGHIKAETFRISKGDTSKEERGLRRSGPARRDEMYEHKERKRVWGLSGTERQLSKPEMVKEAGWTSWIDLSDHAGPSKQIIVHHRLWTYFILGARRSIASSLGSQKPKEFRWCRHTFWGRERQKMDRCRWRIICRSHWRVSQRVGLETCIWTKFSVC